MAGESSMQMLTLAAQVTQNAFSRMDEAMTASLAFQQRNKQMEMEAVQKAASLAESARQADMQIGVAKERNQLDYLDYKQRQSLIPLQMETQKLALEVQKQNFLKQKEELDNKHFDDLTGTMNDAAAFEVIRTHNVDLLKELADHKASYKAQILAGKQFNPLEYKAKQDAILNQDKYKNLPPASDQEGWEGQFSFGLKGFSTSAATLYDKRHPVEKSARGAIAAGVLSSSSATERTSLMIQGKTILNATEMGAIGVGIQQQKFEQEQIERLNFEIKKEEEEIARTTRDDPENAKGLIISANKRIEDKKKDQEKLMQKISDRVLRFSNANFDPVAEAKPKETEKKDPPKFKKKPDGANLDLPSPDNFGSEKSRATYNKIGDIVNLIIPKDDKSKEGTALQGIGVTWLKSPDKVTDKEAGIFTEKIIGNFDKKEDVEKFISHDNLLKLSETITTETEVPVNGVLMEAVEDGWRKSKDASKVFQDPFIGNILQGKAVFSKGNGVKIKKIIDMVDPEEKEWVAKELSALLLTASIKNAIENK